MTIENNDTLTGKPGKLPAKPDARTLDFSTYLDLAKFPAIPPQLDWTVKMNKDWGMMENWTLSDCTCAAAGHMIECWTANASEEKIIRDGDIMKAYIALTGYDPKTGKNDNGAYLSDALKYWRNHGIGRHKIKAYTTVNQKNHDLVRASILLFGGVYVGLSLPNTIKGQAVWDVTPGPLTGDKAPNSFGGHTVTVLAYDVQYLYSISWGKLKKITWAFWDAYCDELYAILTEDFLNENKNPQGFDLPTLEADLLKITKNGKTLQNQLIENEVNIEKPPSKKTDGHSGGNGG